MLLHVTLVVPEGELTWLADLNVWLDPLRLPLFFLVSGYFSTKIFRYSFSELFTRRLWFFLVPYTVWMTVELWTKRTEHHWAFGDPYLQFTDLIYNLLLGQTIAWFIHALIIFNIFLWSVRKLPAWAGMTLSFTPLLFIPWQDHYFFIGNAIKFLPIFVGTAYLRGPITRFADAAEAPFKRIFRMGSLWAYWTAIVSYFAGVFIRKTWNALEGEVTVHWPLPGSDILGRGDLDLLIRFAEQTLETPAGIVGAVLISHIPAVSAFVKFVGRHTLPIYLAHPIGMTVGYGFFMAHRDYAVSLAGQWPMENTWFWIAMCFFYSAAASVALWALGKVPILGWTLVPPRIDKRRSAAEPMVASKEPAEQ